jgi:hypothetical protein
LLLAASAVRSFAYGFLSVILGLYLDLPGLSAAAIGWLFAAALAGGLKIVDDSETSRCFVRSSRRRNGPGIRLKNTSVGASPAVLTTPAID